MTICSVRLPTSSSTTICSGSVAPVPTGTDRLNAPLVTGAGVPLTVTVVLRLSATVPATVTLDAAVHDPSIGELTDRTGAEPSTVTCTCAVASLPVDFRNVTTMVCGPSASVNWHEKLGPFTTPSAWTAPASHAAVTPGPASANVPLTVTPGPRTVALAPGEVTVGVGAARSTVTATLRCVVLPAASVATMANVCAPSGSVANDACQVPLASVATTPSTVTWSAVASDAVP